MREKKRAAKPASDTPSPPRPALPCGSQARARVCTRPSGGHAAGTEVSVPATRGRHALARGYSLVGRIWNASAWNSTTTAP